MKIKRILLIGAGLMGGSFLKYLKLNYKPDYLVVVDTNFETCKSLIQEAYVDHVHNSIDDLNSKDFDLVIVSTPISTISSIIHDVSLKLDDCCTFIDFGSTKANIEKEVVLKNLSHTYIGTHPISGWHLSSYESANSKLFEGKLLVITGKPSKELDSLEEWFKFINIQTKYMSAQEHDALLSISSHIPYIMSLLTLAPIRDLNREEKNTLSEVIASGFRDTTRVSQSNLDWGRDICQHNREFLLKNLSVIKQHLDILIDVIDSSDSYGLETFIQLLSEQRSLVLSD